MHFKSFLLNEERAYLGHQLSDILTSLQNLEQDLSGLGTRQITRISDEVVNQIRRVLHATWTPKQTRYLKDLQKVAVALKKAIEEKDNLSELIPQLSQAVEAISAKLGIKMNDLQGPPPMPPDLQNQEQEPDQAMPPEQEQMPPQNQQPQQQIAV